MFASVNWGIITIENRSCERKRDAWIQPTRADDEAGAGFAEALT